MGEENRHDFHYRDFRENVVRETHITYFRLLKVEQ